MITVGQESNKELENKIDALSRKLEFELQNNLRDDSHFDFQGGILRYHQWVTLSIGSIFMLLALLYQRGSFLYFYLFGLIKVGKDTADAFINEQAQFSPLIYYLFAGLTILIVLTQAGYPVPDMTYGLAENTVKVIP